MPPTGQLIIGFQRVATAETFRAAGAGPDFSVAGQAEVDRACALADAAFDDFRQTSLESRARFLELCADKILELGDELLERAGAETNLPRARLEGERGRTTGQLRLFAQVVRQGDFLGARIDPALPERKPLPRADIRQRKIPLGPVAVFGASNFPLAFSDLGGDTASALAAGCPVIVKAHPAHPGTSELVAQLIAESVAAEKLHPGVFSMLFDSGIDIGAALVRHPLVRAVAFTGSLRAGRALMDLAAARPDPIPCFTEMSSGNPVFVLPGALRKDPSTLARNLFASFTLGAGQFCTKPGIVLVPETAETNGFVTELKQLVASAQPQTLLTAGIARKYRGDAAIRARQTELAAKGTGQEPANACAAEVHLFEVDSQAFLYESSQIEGEIGLSEEIFGPNTLLVRGDHIDMKLIAQALDGHLTATILGDEEDLAANQDLIRILERKAGRLIFNGFPTGVEVTHAMVHGGPYPSTSDPRFTSVGSLAIYRFARPVCFQNFPQSQLPPGLGRPAHWAFAAAGTANRTSVVEGSVGNPGGHLSGVGAKACPKSV